MDKYEFVKDIGAGSFGLARLMRNKATKELVAMKFIERGCKINKNVEREIINHRSLVHPNIIRFMEVILTSTHLVIVMEYAAGGELFDRIRITGRFSENEARFFFQQLISGLSFCHSRQICHRDLKLANTLLDGSPVPILKICDFGFSKSSMLHSTPKSTVGTPAYIAPEVLSRQEYNGKLADVWSIGVTLYIMLVGAYPFEDQAKPKKIKIPEFVYMSQDCRHLLSRILVASASRRITIEEIKNHPWFLKNLPWEQLVAAQGKHQRNEVSAFSSQSFENIMEIVREARKPAMNHFPVSSSNAESGWANKEISRNFLKKLPWEKPEGAQDIDYRNENPTISPKPLESIMEVLGETKPAMNTLSVFSLISGFGLAKKAHYDDQKENSELEVEGEGQYDKQVTEVYEDKQMKEVYVYEDKQSMDAFKSTSYRYKMIKLFYKTSLFLANKFLQIPWYQ